MRHYYLIGFLCLFGACGHEKPKMERPPTVISIGEVTQGDVPIYIDAIGNVYSLQEVRIRPQVGGVLEKAYVEQGQFVRKGDPLYLIDPRPYQAALDKAKAALIKDKATLEFAQNKLSRYKELVQQDFVSKLNYDQYMADVEIAKGQLESDQADVATAELNLEWCRPISPLDGRISQFNIDPGNLVTVNDADALTDIRQISPAEIRFSIVQKDFLRVQEAMKNGTLRFLVNLPQPSDQSREGNIYFVDNHVDLSTGTILLKGTVPNDDEFLWPGEFVKVRLQLSRALDVTLVPEEALQIGSEGSFIYVFDPETSTVDYRVVKRGETSGNQVIVEKGVHEGEKVVLKGQLNLRPGSKVEVAVPSKASL